jgi:hypothetical protein
MGNVSTQFKTAVIRFARSTLKGAFFAFYMLKTG